MTFSAQGPLYTQEEPFKTFTKFVYAVRIFSRTAYTVLSRSTPTHPVHNGFYKQPKPATGSENIDYVNIFTTT